MPVGGERLQDAPVIGRGPVPIGRDQARAEERDRQRRHDAAAIAGMANRGRARRRSPAIRRPDGRSCDAPRPWLAHARPNARRNAGSARSAAQMPAHLGAVTRDEIILAGGKQAFAIVPRRRDQRHAAGERLEHADRRDAGQHPRIGPARHVDRHRAPRQRPAAPGNWRDSRHSRCRPPPARPAPRAG